MVVECCRNRTMMTVLADEAAQLQPGASTDAKQQPCTLTCMCRYNQTLCTCKLPSPFLHINTRIPLQQQLCAYSPFDSEAASTKSWSSSQRSCRKLGSTQLAGTSGAAWPLNAPAAGLMADEGSLTNGRYTFALRNQGQQAEPHKALSPTAAQHHRGHRLSRPPKATHSNKPRRCRRSHP